MTTESVSLRYAVTAFSCLICSAENDKSYREAAWMYHSTALEKLRQLMLNNQLESGLEKVETVWATALVLSAFEVSFHLQLD